MSSEWKAYQFQELCDINRGASPRPIHDYLGDEGMPWIKIADATAESSRFMCKSKERIRLSGVRASVEVFPGDLILSNSATPGLPKFMKINACIHDGWMILRNFRNLDKDFAYWLLLAERINLVAQGNGSVFTNLKTEILKNHTVTIPPTKCQRKIAEILNNLDDRIALLRETNTTLETIAQALFKSWFVDFDPVRAKQEGRESEGMDADTAAIFPDSFEKSELGLVPTGWSVGTIDQATSIIIDYRGKTPKKLGRDWSDSGIPAVSAKNIKNGRLVQKQAMNFVDRDLYDIWMKDKLMSGDILMTSEAPLGELLFLADDHIFCLSQRVFAMRANPINCFPSFLYFWMSSRNTQDRIVSRATGTTVVGIRQSELRKVEVLLPPLSIQEKANQIFGSCLLRIEKNEAQKETLTTLRDTLLPRLISGQLRLPDAEGLVEDAAS